MTQPFDFEAACSQLEKLIEQMESGKLSLEKTLQNFEQGVHLVRECQTVLRQAEQKVQVLLNVDGTATLMPYEYRDPTI